MALLVDGENISQDHSGQIVTRAAGFGALVVKRVYGNAAQLPKWDAAPGFRLIHSGSGKNATDLLLSIEAVSLCHEAKVDTVVIASSDRDFSHLAHHLRERGITVFGIGEAKAPETFRRACDRFIELAPRAVQTTRAVDAQPANFTTLIVKAMQSNHRDDGWCSVAWLGHQLRKIEPNFDQRLYGPAKLSDLVRATKGLRILEHGKEGLLVQLEAHPAPATP